MSLFLKGGTKRRPKLPPSPPNLSGAPPCPRGAPSNPWGLNRKEMTMRKMIEASARARSEEHTSELQSLMRISYAVFCLKKKKYITAFTILVINMTTMILTRYYITYLYPIPHQQFDIETPLSI